MDSFRTEKILSGALLLKHLFDAPQCLPGPFFILN